MSDQNTSNKSRLKFIALGAVLLVGLAGIGVFMAGTKTEQAPVEAPVDAAAEQSVVIDNSVNLEKAKTERVLGDKSAPIKITEHASLTCSHCANFHKNTLPELIKNYVDTGKAYIVFSDFPLNAPALHGSMISRCLPEDQYFEFVKTLFETQEGWAFDVGYMDILKTKAAAFGMSGEQFNACLQSKELEAALLDRIKAVQAQWEVKSTPSFVINNQIVISGAASYAEFEKSLQEALAEIAKKSAEAQAPSTDSAPALNATEGE